MESSDLLDNVVPSNQVEESMMREVSLVRELSQAADRNMHNWYAEYAQLMKDYKAEFDADLACSNPEYLQAKLDIIKLAVAKVSSQHTFTLHCKTLPVAWHNFLAHKAELHVLLWRMNTEHKF